MLHQHTDCFRLEFHPQKRSGQQTKSRPQNVVGECEPHHSSLYIPPLDPQALLALTPPPIFCIGSFRQRRCRQILHNHPTRPLSVPRWSFSWHSRCRSHRSLHSPPPGRRRCENHPSARWLAPCRSPPVANPSSAPISAPKAKS